MATVTVEAYQEEGGEKNRSKRKEKRSRRKERDIPGTNVSGASHSARADATRGGGSCGARADAGEAGRRVDIVQYHSLQLCCFGGGGLSREILVAQLT